MRGSVWIFMKHLHIWTLRTCAGCCQLVAIQPLLVGGYFQEEGGKRKVQCLEQAHNMLSCFKRFNCLRKNSPTQAFCRFSRYELFFSAKGEVSGRGISGTENTEVSGNYRWDNLAYKPSDLVPWASFAHLFQKDFDRVEGDRNCRHSTSNATKDFFSCILR